MESRRNIRKPRALGKCFLCKQRVARRREKGIIGGAVPTYKFIDNGKKLFHKNCFTEYKKSIPKIVNVEYETPNTPFGKFRIS